MKKNRVLVIGAGLAGVDASYFLAQNGIEVVLLENKMLQKNPSQKLDGFAELVCTNSLKSKDPSSAHGLLKTEMQHFNSLVVSCAYEASVPAGDALAVNREDFSNLITSKISEHENITVVQKEGSDPLEHAKEYECDYTIIATGPLTTDKISSWIQTELSQDDFYFYDAIAPVVDAESLDYSKLYFKDRHKEIDESADYLNAAMNEEQYYEFIDAMVAAPKVEPKDFEEYKFFEACLPIDLMAERGRDTARFSCMKPIGLGLAEQKRPFAVVQLRKENLLGSAFNLVGFQTRLKYPDQKRIFSMIPGFANAEFIHLGSVHRNSFLNARKLLNWDMSTQKYPNLYFAGQITGVEGYSESASSGLYVAVNLLKKIKDQEFKKWPVETAMGALINYIMTSEKPAPSNINFGLLPTIKLNKEQRKDKKRKRIKKQLAAARANEVFADFVAQAGIN
ncbi:MAG: methylenetetrahydrofolate--tRNA-(uracil(54)-C(5))-methyltransferase (FADH(2)-oxidizing) TrmFO [Halobacteriovoraceae bacterium]|jgi:methylenetetrahydrofolate--tRNA-(uracil-5-)-methyltransferase|nr:methylenetetrahydrofolate--tRNA-(uracil(54)-C(5))-methyltransferase (FADH(2)-oxidizing) TrmFO [Halobacteriovoraceae bacterium]